MAAATAALTLAGVLLLGSAGSAGSAGSEGSEGSEGSAAATRRQQFEEAGRAYAQGRAPAAARLYEELIKQGFASMEVFYNLGNAQLKSGRPGLAVLNYRKAWRLAPRDPDVRDNLHAVLRSTGASEAEPSGPEIAATVLSEKEWAIVAAAAWWTTCLVLCLAVLFRGGRRVALRVAAATGVAVVAALLGLWTWRGFDRNPEFVVLKAGLSALQAPLDSSPPRFPLPEGSVVRVRTRQGAWVEVPSGQLAGWIRRADCVPVLLEIFPD